MRLPTRLLQRKINAHKGDFGHIFILAGSRRFSGAAGVSSEAAMRSGAGLVTLGIPESINEAVIKIKPKEIMTLPLPESKEGSLSLKAFSHIEDFIRQADVVVIGPGLSLNRDTKALVRRVISGISKPMVIDADGLNALSGHLDLLSKAGPELNAMRILTPHPGEMARLLGINIEEVEKQRKIVAKNFAKEYNVTVILKGYESIVADYRGNSYVNKTGNPGMATAGSGDVLTGIIAAFLGQGLSVFDAAKYGVYLHGLAGDLSAEEKTQISLIASDIIANIPAAVRKCF